MQVIIIGGSCGGIQAALTLKKLNCSTEIILIEKNNNLSYISSGISLKLNGLIDELNLARYATVNQLMKLGIKVLLNTTVSRINNSAKEIICHKKVEGKVLLSYDKLILATGSNQFSMNVTLPTKDKVTVFKNYESSLEVVKKLESVHSVTIIGGGYSGIELCDALKGHGKKIHLIESAKSLLFRYVGKEIAALLKEKMVKAGICIHLDESAIGFSETESQTFTTITTNKEIKNEYVIIAVNARPDRTLVKDLLDITVHGTVQVNESMQTSDPDIFALGDMISSPVSNSSRSTFIPLINNVVRSAMVAALTIQGHSISYTKTQKTTATKVFGCYIASTGLTEIEAAIEGFEVESIFLTIPYQLPYLNKQEEVHIKLVFEKETHKLLGGQLMSEKDITQSIDTLSLAIAKQTTLEELVTMDFFFHPRMNQPLGIIGRAAYELLMKKYQE